MTKLSKQQNKAIELIKAMEVHFGVRWFVQAELAGITLHTMKALVQKECIEEQVFDELSYYRYKG